MSQWIEYSIEVDVYSFQATVNKVLSERFYPYRAQQNLGQQYEFLDLSANQYGSRLEWSGDKFWQSLCENAC